MNIQQIKQAVDSGCVVHWSNSSYRVIKDSLGQYLIVYRGAGVTNCIGLTNLAGDKLNGKPADFYGSPRWKVAELFRFYMNDFLTVKYFAEYHGITENRAARIIRVGKYWHIRGAEFYKRDHAGESE